MQPESFEAFVLRVTPYMDRDLIVTLLTRNGSRVDAYARGAKVSKKRFNGSLDLFNLVKGIIKTRGSDHLAELVECHVIQGLQDTLGRDIQKYALFSYVSELIAEFLKASQSIDGLFESLNETLKKMSSDVDALFLLVDLESRLIQLFGYWPSWNLCSRCHIKADHQVKFFFKPGEGVLICDSCLTKNSYNKNEFVTLTPDLLEALMDPEEKRPLLLKKKRVLFENLIHHVLGRKLKSHDFLSQVF